MHAKQLQSQHGHKLLHLPVHNKYKNGETARTRGHISIKTPFSDNHLFLIVTSTLTPGEGSLFRDLHRPVFQFQNYIVTKCQVCCRSTF